MTAGNIIVTYNSDREVITKGDSWVYTDSLNLAEVLDYPHKRVLERVRQILDDYDIFEDSQLKCPSSKVDDATEFINKHTDFTYSISYYRNSQNKLQPYYKLSKDLLVLVIFSFRKLPNAQMLQKAYIAQFNAMEKELNWYRARYLGIDVRNDLTEAIQEYIEVPKFYHYKNFTDLVYKSLYGMSAVQIREINGLEKGENIRKYLYNEDLDKVKKLETEIVTLLSYGFDYKKIKSLLEARFDGGKEELVLKPQKLEIA